MIKKEILQKTSDNGGLLRLTSVGIHREVYAYDNLIASGVDWGYNGELPRKLSEAILAIFKDEVTQSSIDSFSMVITQFLPDGSFDVVIKIQELLEIIFEGKQGDFHAYDFMFIKMGSNYISKHLDFSKMGKSCRLNSDSIEYNMLLELSEDFTVWTEFKAYLENETKFNNPINDFDTQYAVIEHDEFEKCFKITDCLGSGEYLGSQNIKKIPESKIYLKNR